MHPKKTEFVITPLRAGVLVLAVHLGGCSLLSDTNPGNDSLDYRSGATKTPSLEVPPDLTPLSRDSRYQPQSGSISASALAASGVAATRPAADPNAAGIAIQQSGDVRLERAGDSRWLVSPQAPDQLWPKLRQFWLDRGFTIASETPEAGTLETNWAENRAKIPNDIVRRTIGTVVSGLFDSGERDRFMMRLERTPTGGSEIYVTHHGLEEKVLGRSSNEEVVWSARPADPQLEREMLTRMMVALGTSDSAARAQVASVESSPAAADAAPAKARLVTGQPGAALQVDDNLERAWRRIGLALDRGGFTVEDRDRTQGVYFVRFIDTKEAAKDEPNFFTRWFSGDDKAAKALNRYRIQIKAEGTGTLVSVQNNKGEPDNSANAQKIVSLLVDELKR